MIGFIFGLIIVAVGFIFRGYVTLVFRFDILNALVVSGLVQLLVIHKEWSNFIRWSWVLIVFLVCFVLQRIYKSVKFILAGVSTILIMAIGYGWASYDSRIKQFMVVSVCLVVAVILNSICWMRKN